MDDLSNIAHKLNEKSDRLNSTISLINEKLARLNLGVEVWLSEPIMPGLYEDSAEWANASDVRRQETTLGYCRVEDERQLAVRIATHVMISGNEWVHPEIQIRNARHFPLLKATREIRVQAMAQVPALLIALKMQAEALLESIESAEKAAEALFEGPIDVTKLSDAELDTLVGSGTIDLKELSDAELDALVAAGKSQIKN